MGETILRQSSSLWRGGCPGLEQCSALKPACTSSLMHLDSSQGTRPFLAVQMSSLSISCPWFFIPPALQVPVQPGSAGRLLVPADRGRGANCSPVQCVGSPLDGAAVWQIPSKGHGLGTITSAATFRGVPTQQPLGAWWSWRRWECFTSRNLGLRCLWV